MTGVQTCALPIGKVEVKRKMGSCRSAKASPAVDSMLRMDEVTKSFGPIDAADEISLDVRRGEILTLLGPSGCGKTTTLRMIVGLERATSGRVSFNNAPVDDKVAGVFVPPNRRNMGMVFQSYAIWPHMTVFENVAYPLRVRRVPKHDIITKMRNVLQLVGLSGYEERPATRLSGGQMQD